VSREQAGTGARPGSGKIGLGDALITDEPGVVLLTLHADCLPLLLVDPFRPAVAAVHAGWRGTVADVAGTAVRGMVEAFASRPDTLLAYIGPAIGPCCYEVGPEVAAAWSERAGADAALALNGSGAPRLDLVAANRLLLARAGVSPTSVESSGICTRCHGEAWFSHRGQGATTGRFGAFIGLTERPAAEGERDRW
jgi:YfiH family protein